MKYFSKFMLIVFCMCNLNFLTYGMESGAAAPEVTNSDVNTEELPTPGKDKSEINDKTESNNEVKPNDETKPENETKDKVESGEKTEPSSEEKSKEDSSNVVGKVTVNVKERESNMDYYIIYDEDGNIVEIKDAKDSSDDSDERCKDRVKSYSYSQEIVYYRVLWLM